MERLTSRKRNHDGSGCSNESLVIEHGMRKGMPSGYCGAIVTKLADLEDLEEQGMLMKLPCKVGDTVYRFYTVDDTTRIYEHHLTTLTNIVHIMELGEIGKTVFLTQAEAEEALQKLRRE